MCESHNSRRGLDNAVLRVGFLNEVVLGFGFLTKFPESFSIAKLLGAELIESFWEPFLPFSGRL